MTRIVCDNLGLYETDIPLARLTSLTVKGSGKSWSYRLVYRGYTHDASGFTSASHAFAAAETLLRNIGVC